MRHVVVVVPVVFLLLAGCATGGGEDLDTGTDTGADPADTSGDVPFDPADVSDPWDTSDPAPDPVSDTPAGDSVADPAEEEPPIDTYETRPETIDTPPDTTVEPPPETTDTPWETPDIVLDWPIDIYTDPSGDCSAGTCTDYVGRTVCAGGSGFIICPLDSSCLQMCYCDAPGVWSICRMPCIC